MHLTSVPGNVFGFVRTGVTKFSRLWRVGERPFARHLLLVMSGTALAQLTTFLFTPILSRMYGPSDFGSFGAYGAVLAVLGTGATLNYTDALMLPQDGQDAAPLLLAAGLSTTFIALGTGLGCALITRPCLALLGLTSLGRGIWFLPLSVLVLGLSLCLNSWCIRQKAFRASSAGQLLRAGVACGAQATAGTARLGGIGLIGAALVAEVSVLVFLGRAALARDAKVFLAAVDWRLLGRSAWRYRAFALYGAPMGVMNALSQGLPVILFTHYYGAAVAGFYVLAVRLLQTPMNFVLVSVRQVLFQKLAEIAARGHDLSEAFQKATGSLAAVVILPSACIFLAAPRVVALVFGESWRETGEYARWLVFWLAPMFCNVPATLTARILRLQRDLFIFDALLLSARLAALWYGGLNLPPLETIILFSMVGSLLNILLIVHVAFRARSHASQFSTP